MHHLSGLRPTNRMGFTLVEIMVALTLLASVTAFTFYSFSSSVRLTRTEDSVAFNYARGLIEQLYESVRQDRWGLGGFPLSTAPAPHTTTKILNGVTFTGDYVVNDLDADGIADGVGRDVNLDGQEDYRRVDLTVSW